MATEARTNLRPMGHNETKLGISLPIRMGFISSEIREVAVAAMKQHMLYTAQGR